MENTHTLTHHIAHLVTALSAVSAQSSSDTRQWIHVLPAGSFRAVDGRPIDIESWYIDKTIATEIIATFKTVGLQMVVDYEHQTINAETNGNPAPAAGWITELEWRDDGMYALVSWTERAREMIARKEYQYISPVFAYDDNGKLIDLLHVALTNNPGLNVLNPVALKRAAQLKKASIMNPTILELLRKILGLGADADEAAIIKELTAVADGLVKNNATATMSSVLSDVDALSKKVEALKAETLSKQSSQSPDPLKYAPVSEVTALTQQLAALTQQVQSSELNSVIKEALADGRILPAQEERFREIGRTNLVQLKGLLEVTPKIGVLSQMQSATAANTFDGVALTDDELVAAKLTGKTPAEFAALKKQTT